MKSQNLTPHESLIELIFAKCSLVWGREFLGRWEGLDIGEVKADWARELGRLLDHPSKIRHALENLPPKPPTVMQFRDACIAAPSPNEVPELEDDRKADPQRIAAELGKMRVALAGKPDPKAWARRLRIEELGGHRLTEAQRALWRAALSNSLGEIE